MQRSLSVLAGRQFAVFSANQAFGHDVSRSTLQRWVANGTLWTPQAGVYALAAAPRTWEQSLAAALLGAGPGAAASHRSAARLWKLTDTADDTVEVTVPRGRNPRLRGAVVHRSKDLAASQCLRHRGLWVTNPLRAMVDLAAVLPAEAVEDALDRGLVARRFSVAAVEWMLHELARPGRHGTGALGRILARRALGNQRPDGLLEPRMARLLRTAGLPTAEFQFVILDPGTGRFLARVDFAYPPRRVALEVDGYAVHGSPRAMSADFVRQNRLAALGWTVLRFTWAQVVRHPGEVAAAVAAALALSSPAV